MTNVDENEPTGTQPRITESVAARAFGLRLSGSTWQSIADEIGISRQALYEWRKREGIDEHLEDFWEEATETARLKLLDLMPTAVDALRTVLTEAPEHKDRVAAAREVLRAVEAWCTAGTEPRRGEQGSTEGASEFVPPPTLVSVAVSTEEERRMLPMIQERLAASGIRVRLADRKELFERARRLVREQKLPENLKTQLKEDASDLELDLAMAEAELMSMP